MVARAGLLLYGPCSALEQTSLHNINTIKPVGHLGWHDVFNSVRFCEMF